MSGRKVLHVAFSDDWEACERFGEYNVATRNTLYEVEGFVHATTLAGLPAVLDGVYADASTPPVLAVIDEDALADEGIEVSWEQDAAVPGGLAPRSVRSGPPRGPAERSAGRAHAHASTGTTTQIRNVSRPRRSR